MMDWYIVAKGLPQQTLRQSADDTADWPGEARRAADGGSTVFNFSFIYLLLKSYTKYNKKN